MMRQIKVSLRTGFILASIAVRMTNLCIRFRPEGVFWCFAPVAGLRWLGEVKVFDDLILR